MKSTSNSLLGKRFVRVSIACLVVLLAGESAASAYQYPTKPKHRQYRIFVSAQKITKSKSFKMKSTTATNSAKSLMMQTLVSSKALTTNSTATSNFASVEGETPTVLITPTVAPGSMDFGSNTVPAIGFTRSLPIVLEEPPVCGIFTDAAGTIPVAISPTTPIGTYYVHCSGQTVHNILVANAPVPDYYISYAPSITFDVVAPTPPPTPITIQPTLNGEISAVSINHGSAAPVVGFTELPVGHSHGTSCALFNGGTQVPADSNIPVGSYVARCAGAVADSGYVVKYGSDVSLTVNPYTPPLPPPPSGPVEPPVIHRPIVIPDPELSQVARPIVVLTKPKVKKTLPQRFSRSAMLSTRVANFITFTKQAGKTASIAIPHDAGTKIQLTEGVQASVKTRLKLVTTETGIDITSVNGWTGRISVPVVATVDGKLVERFIGVIEVPGPVLNPEFYLADVNSATISWKADGSQVVFYHVFQGSDLICSTPKTTCTQVKSVNTHAVLKIEAIGHQSTYSSTVSPAYAKNKLVQAEVVHFASGSYTLALSDKSTLDQFIRESKSLGLNIIEIIGHTDTAGSFTQNKILSLARANAVRAYIANSFKDVQFIIKGQSSTIPLSANATAAGRQDNRRAEVFIG